MSILKLLREQTYYGTEAAGILPFCTTTGRFLIALRSDEVNEPNTYNLWGGKLDTDESDVKDVAKREFKEETGYNGQIELIPSHVYRVPKFTYHNFIGLMDKEFEPELNWETADYGWITLEELYDLEPKHFGLKELLRVKRIQIEQIVNQYAGVS